MMLTLVDSPCKLHWLRAYYITGDEVHGSSIFAKITQAEQDGKKTSRSRAAATSMTSSTWTNWPT